MVGPMMTLVTSTGWSIHYDLYKLESLLLQIRLVQLYSIIIFIITTSYIVNRYDVTYDNG